VYVINTCSVTAKSDYQCRQDPVGGAPEMAPGSWSRVLTETRRGTQEDPGRRCGFGNRDKTEIAEHIMSTSSVAPAQAPVDTSVPIRTTSERGAI
jgi:hypothetical protein